MLRRAYIVGVERGYGPRHAFNAQEGTEAVPSELPTPPDAPDTLGDRIRRSLFEQVRQGIIPDEALAEIKRDPTSLRSLMAYGEGALAAGTLLSGGKGMRGGERLPMREKVIDLTDHSVPHELRGPTLALKLKDGTIVHANDVRLHSQLLERAGVDPESVIDSGIWRGLSKIFESHTPESVDVYPKQE